MIVLTVYAQDAMTHAFVTHEMIDWQSCQAQAGAGKEGEGRILAQATQAGGGIEKHYGFEIRPGPGMGLYLFSESQDTPPAVPFRQSAACVSPAIHSSWLRSKHLKGVGWRSKSPRFPAGDLARFPGSSCRGIHPGL